MSDDVDAALVESERARLADLLDHLDDAQWSAPSLCAGWRVREVVAHLLMPYELSPVRFAGLMARHRFSLDRAADAWARGDRRPAPALVSAWRATAGKRFPAGGGRAALTHGVIHGLDLAYPLGDRRPVPLAAARVVLDGLVTRPAERLRRPGLLDGVAMVAEDVDWRHGDGPAVTGPGWALILMMAGRTAALGELGGDGAQTIRVRAGAVAGGVSGW